MAPSKIFTLEGKGLKLDTAADAEAHIKPLREMVDVEEVRLLGNTLGVEACEAIGKVLATKKTLQIANLADIFTGRLLDEIPKAISALLTGLLLLPKLHTINLNDNAFGLKTVKPLVEFLKSHVPLQHLILNNNGLGPYAGIEIADALSALHAKKVEARKTDATVPDLETVICGRNRLEAGSMEAWARAYSLHNGVKVVKMVQNGIRPQGIQQLLTKGLGNAKGIKTLDLQDNTFTIKGSKALAGVVTGWTEIQELGLGDSLLGSKGAVAFANSLGKGQNKKLEILRLQFNDITSAGLGVFAEVAKSSLLALKKIELNGNKFSEEDSSLTQLKDLLDGRKESLAGEVVIEDDWGVDSLSDLESDDGEDDEEDEEEEEESELEELREREVEADEKVRENEPVVAQKKDPVIDDELAGALEKVKISAN
ncbi:hypothetical protein HYALB_00004170 [Hymenoscyphus albidus]|uniref:Ran GTPase activating protein 1 n=1 Tax=Hymenoscyphus albidus TaxID=595503 RepID=A0A9N9M4P9_9HELO|nr:hypothetical protein HYALB_00004170 [Hymenoscyphus albidus]